MKPWTSIFRRERRPRPNPEAPRKRPGRSFAATLASLESRSLLTVIGSATFSSILVPVPEIEHITLTAANPSDSPTPPLDAVGVRTPGTPLLGPGGPPKPPPDATDLASTASISNIDPPGGPAPDSQAAGSAPIRGPGKGRVTLSTASLSIAGFITPELALANAGENKVVVRTGFGPDQAITTLSSSDGIRKPQSVTLGDLNNDGIPDLIVANSGTDSILIYPGMPGGLFGPEINGGKGIPVGVDPVGVTIDSESGDGVPSLIVANKGSASLTILDGQITGGEWVATMASTLAVGLEPVKTVLFDYTQDGQPDLFVCNSGSNTVAMYKGLPGGTFDTANPSIFDVGITPSEMFVGQFDKRQQPDLITVNFGSDDVTFIGGVYSVHPTTQSIASGGTGPDAAFAFSTDPAHSKVMDLVVANSGDGHLALLQAANEGMQLAGYITQAKLPAPTGIALLTSTSAEVDFFAASAGQDAAQLLQFDLQTVSPFLENPFSERIPGNDDLVAELMPFGGSSLETIAVFWVGIPDSVAVTGEWGLREPSTITALYSPTEGQGAISETSTQEVVNNAPNSTLTPLPELSNVDSSECFSFVSGVYESLSKSRGFIEVVAARDARESGEERTPGELARIDPKSIRSFRNPDDDSAMDVVDEALHLFWSEGRAIDSAEPIETDDLLEPDRPLEGIDPPGLEGQQESVPLISTALLLSTRLILEASPPRPSSFRKGERRPGFFGFGRLGQSSRPCL